jgi:subtilisin
MTKISRRTLLGSAVLVGTGLGLRNVSAAERSQRYSVGTSGQAGTQAAKEYAEEVIRVLNLGDEKQSVTGIYTSQAVETLRQRDDIRYVERDQEIPIPEPPEVDPGETTPGPQGTPTSPPKPQPTPTDKPDVPTETAEQNFYPWGMEQIGVDIVHHSGEKGAGAHIAIIDSGIDAKHPDLPNLGKGTAIQPCRTESCATEWDDNHGHGTFCAGVIGAADNGEYVTGVAPDATLHAIKADNEQGMFSWSDTASGIIWATDQGYDVINMSFGGPIPSILQKEAIKYAYENGVLLVASAGNEGSCSDCVGYPAAHDEVIAVSATNHGDNLSFFSSTGPEIELSAPGSYIRTLDPVSGPLAVFWRWGTSFAAPHVAGAAALLMAQGYTNEEARQRLRDTATDIGLSENEQGSVLHKAA